jgi:type IV secretion system protein VirB3
MRWGVTYAALLFNVVLTMEIFLMTKNLLTLSLCAPVHGVCWLLCARDPRFFDLLLLWGRTRLPALLANLALWRAASYSPLVLDLPAPSGQRKRGLVCMRMPVPSLPVGTGAPTSSPRQGSRAC